MVVYILFFFNHQLTLTSLFAFDSIQPIVYPVDRQKLDLSVFKFGQTLSGATIVFLLSPVEIPSSTPSFHSTLHLLL